MKLILTSSAVLVTKSLYSPQGFLHSKAASLVGIENNAYFCEIQQRMVAKYNMAGKVQIMCSDVLEQGQLLASADVVVLNYVFDMFRTLEERARYASSVTVGLCNCMNEISVESFFIACYKFLLLILST